MRTGSRSQLFGGGERICEGRGYCEGSQGRGIRRTLVDVVCYEGIDVLRGNILDYYKGWEEEDSSWLVVTRGMGWSRDIRGR